MKYLLLLLLSLVLLIPSNASAQDASISCDNSSCSPSSLPSFLPITSWYPSLEMAKTVEINNISSSPLSISAVLLNSYSTNDLASVIRLKISKLGSNLWSDALNNTYQSSNIPLGSLDPHTSNLYKFLFVMDRDSGNEYQNSSTGFDLAFKIAQTGSQNDSGSGNSPIPTPTPGSNSHNNSSGNSGSSSNNSGSTTSTVTSSTTVLGNQIRSVLGQLISQLTGSQADSTPEGETLGASTEAGLKNINGGTKTKVNSDACSTNYLWLIVLPIELVLLFLAKKIIFSKRRLFYIISLVTLSMIIIYLLVCTKILSLLALSPLLILLPILIKKESNESVV